MSPYESLEMSQTEFVALTEHILANAAQSTADLRDSVDLAQVVITKVDQIENGIVTIEPPVTQEQLDLYHRRADDIVNLGERAISALYAAEQPRRIWQRARPVSTALVPASPRSLAVTRTEPTESVVFQGNGSAVKS